MSWMTSTTLITSPATTQPRVALSSVIIYKSSTTGNLSPSSVLMFKTDLPLSYLLSGINPNPVLL